MKFEYKIVPLRHWDTTGLKFPSTSWAQKGGSWSGFGKRQSAARSVPDMQRVVSMDPLYVATLKRPLAP
jgi:hypothetical protein